MYKKEEVDIILANSIEFFTLCDIKFKLPIIWEDKPLPKIQISEWSNYFSEDYGGMYHSIKIDFSKLESDLDLLETFLHELVHALQYEQKLPIDHKAYFLQWVKYFEELGFNISSADCQPLKEFTGQFNDLLCNPERYK